MTQIAIRRRGLIMATNSIIITNLPNWSKNSVEDTTLEETEQRQGSEVLPSTFLESLRSIIEGHGEIAYWVPVRRYLRNYLSDQVFVEYSVYSGVKVMPKLSNLH